MKILIIILALVVLGNTLLNHIEKVECVNWQNDAKYYEGWYASDWQVEQCNNFGINL